VVEVVFFSLPPLQEIINKVDSQRICIFFIDNYFVLNFLTSRYNA
jgi:hypothetical protein